MSQSNLSSDLLDMQHLYAKGYYRSFLTPELTEELTSLVKAENWILDTTASYPVIDASWDHNTRSTEPKKVPAGYHQFINKFLEYPFMNPYTELFGKFSSINMALHKTPVDYFNGWHGHFMDGFHLHILFHLSDSPPQEEDGGKIEYGYIFDPSGYTLNPQEYNMKPTEKIIQTASMLCPNGSFEVLLNSHPMYRHQITRVNKDYGRKTFMVLCGYKDNILIDKLKIDHI